MAIEARKSNANSRGDGHPKISNKAWSQVRDFFTKYSRVPSGVMFAHQMLPIELSEAFIEKI